jgi:indolepyruvate ferredoxin oxidoreductase alpha subunit
VLRKLGFKAPDAKERPLKKDEIVVTSDIGCYTLGVYPPLAALDTCACMGASVGQALGLEKAGIPNKAIAVLGDSTFMHSGITGLVDIVYNGGSSTVIILDNRTTAMTGHQGHPGTGISARGTDTGKVEMETLCRGIGVEDVNVIDAYNVKELESTIKRCVNSEKPSVIIARGNCSLQTRSRGTPFYVNTDECAGCLECLNLGCPAIIPDDSLVRIDTEICIGTVCGVCSQICPQEAIVEGER